MKSLIISILLVLLTLTNASSDVCVLEDFGIAGKIGANISKPIDISVGELKLIYNGTIKNWKTGERIRVFVRPHSDYEQNSMILSVLGVSLAKFRETISFNKHIQGVKMPKMENKLIKYRGSIGMVSDDEIYMDTRYGFVLLRVVY